MARGAQPAPTTAGSCAPRTWTDGPCMTEPDPDPYTDPYTLANPMTDDQLAGRRAKSLGFIRRMGADDSSFTCDGCPTRRQCYFAFDALNTRGYCLLDK